MGISWPYRQSREQLAAADLGVLQQRELYAHLESMGAAPPVIDAGDFLRDLEMTAWSVGLQCTRFAREPPVAAGAMRAQRVQCGGVILW